jgi:hypothetical protein
MNRGRTDPPDHHALLEAVDPNELRNMSLTDRLVVQLPDETILAE